MTYFTTFTKLKIAIIATSINLTSMVIGQDSPTIQAKDKTMAEKEPTSNGSSPQSSIKKPELVKINATTYKLGEIKIDTKLRTISFDAVTEITENLIEYVLVNPEGKIHEALFVTNASPTNLNIAFKLLGYQENKSLFKEFVNDLPTETFQEASDEQKAESYFKIDVSWIDAETKKLVTHNINELIINDQTKTALGTAQSKTKWSYGGSFVHKGQFIAELNRDIIAIFTDRSAVANFTGKGRDDDTLWFPLTSKVPAFGTKATLVITPEFPAKKK